MIQEQQQLNESFFLEVISSLTPGVKYEWRSAGIKFIAGNDKLIIDPKDSAYFQNLVSGYFYSSHFKESLL